MLCCIELVPLFLGEKALVFQVFKITCMGGFFCLFVFFNFLFWGGEGEIEKILG